MFSKKNHLISSYFISHDNLRWKLVILRLLFEHHIIFNYFFSTFLAFAPIRIVVEFANPQKSLKMSVDRY